LLWFVVWQLMVSDLPENHPSIGKKELEMILSSRSFDPRDNSNEKDVPTLLLLKDMLMSPPTVLLMLCEFANSWGLYTLLTEGPAFFKEVLNFDIAENGIFSSLPYIGRFVGAQIFGFISSFVTSRGYLKALNMQKICVCSEFLVPAAGLVVLSFITNQPYLCVAIMSIAYGFNGAIYSGHTLNGLAIAPNRAGSIMGLTNGFGSSAGILVPLVKSGIVGEPISCDQLIKRWKIIFGIPACIYTLVAVLFIFGASDKVQSYDTKIYEKKKNIQTTPVP